MFMELYLMLVLQQKNVFKQHFCDSSHKGTKFKTVVYKAKETKIIFLRLQTN